MSASEGIRIWVSFVRKKRGVVDSDEHRATETVRTSELAGIETLLLLENEEVELSEICCWAQMRGNRIAWVR